MQYYPLGLALVVTQTEENHADIRDLLTALRRLQDVEVAVQLRVVSTSGCVLDRSGMTPCSTGKPVLLDDDQFKEFIGLAMSKMEGTVMQAPKITAFSGQRVRIRVEDEERFLDGMDVVQQDGRAVLLPRYKTVCNGFDFKVRPTVAADRGSVRLEMDLGMTDPRNEERHPFGALCVLDADGVRVQVRRNISVPDGKTAVLFVRPADGTPAAEDECLLLLVTPRVVINESEEQEVIPNGTLPPIPRP